jgi:hypothetical protein
MIIDQLFTSPLFEQAPMASPEQLAYNKLRAQWDSYQTMTSGGGNTAVSRDPAHAAKLATIPAEIARMAAALKAKGIDAEAQYDALSGPAAAPVDANQEYGGISEAIRPGVDTVASVKKLWQYINRNLTDLASNASFEEEHSNQPYIEDRLADLLKTADGDPVTIAFDMGGNLEFDNNVLYVPVGNMWRYRGLIYGADFVKRVVGFLSKQTALPAVKESKSDPITQFASNAHEEWRRNFDPTGTKPRIKKNSDGTEGDINVPFEKLHPDWKKENLAAGHAAHHAVKHFGRDMEKAAEHVHNEWMKRNPKADYNAAQHVPYDDLSDDEKEKDRVHVRTMMRLMGHHPKQGVAEATDPKRDKAERMIWKYFGQIYDYGDDDGLNYLDEQGDLWNQLMDKYNGEIDDIVAQEPIEVLMQAAQELKGIAGDMKYELDEAAQGHTIEAHGVRGMDRRTWHKTFRNTDQMMAWAEKHDAEIIGTRDLEQARHHNLSPAGQDMAEGSLRELANTSLKVKEPKNFVNTNDRKQVIYKVMKFKSGKDTYLINFIVKGAPAFGKKQNWNAVNVSFGVREDQDDYSFGDEINTDLTAKNKNQFLIYSTVINAVRKFITEYNTEIDEIIMQGAGERQEAIYQRFFQSAGKYFPGWHHDGKHSLVRDVPRQTEKKVKEQGVAEGLTEMDKSQTPPGRDGGQQSPRDDRQSRGRDTGPRSGPDRVAKPVSKQKATRDMGDMFNQAFTDSHKKKRCQRSQPRDLLNCSVRTG